jgi:hypothetical protein
MPTVGTKKPPEQTALQPLRIGGEVKFAAAGSDAKSVGVTITARSGDPVQNYFWGAIVHDFAGMKVKPKIPLDYQHDPSTSIGYLDTFDTSSGDLVCTGEIVTVDEREDGLGDDGASALVAKMNLGVPYQASIQFDEEMSLEYVPDGMTVDVNGRDIPGPVTVVRQWELDAVAICKFGCDPNTSANIKFSAAGLATTPAGPFLFRVTKATGGTMPTGNEPAKTPTTPATPATPAAATALSAPATEPAATTTVVAPPAAVAATVVLSDAQTQFKKFADAFGDRAATYFSACKTFEDALALHLKFQGEKIAELTTKLSAVDRGGAEAVKFAATNEPGEGGKTKTGMAAVIRIKK